MLSYVCSGLLLGFSMLMDKWLNFTIALSMMIYRAKMEKSPLSLRGQILLADRPGCTQHVWMHGAEVYWMRICIICRVCIRHCSVNNIFQTQFWELLQTVKLSQETLDILESLFFPDCIMVVLCTAGILCLLLWLAFLCCVTHFYTRHEWSKARKTTDFRIKAFNRGRIYNAIKMYFVIV